MSVLGSAGTARSRFARAHLAGAATKRKQDDLGPSGSGRTAPTPSQIPAEDHNAVLDAAMVRVEKLEPRLAAIIETILHKYGDIAARNFTRHVTIHQTAAGPPNLQGDGWTSPFPDQLINVDQLVADILGKTQPVREALIRNTMDPALSQAGIGFDVTNPLIAGQIANTGAQVKRIADTTRANIMNIIGQAVQAGLTVPQTSGLIRTGMRSASGTRATTIARTEMARAVNGGSLVATQMVAAATGSNYNKTWHTAIGARWPRHEDYEGLDGQTVGLEEMFQVGESELMYPGDPNGDPGDTINCRCGAPWVPISARARSASRRFYEGQLVRVKTAHGRELSVTPNHPILTRHGWVQAGLIREGDDIVCRSRLDISSGCPDVDDVPAEAEQRFAALQLAAVRGERVPARAVDFHGEVPVGEVEVVWADDALSLHDESALGEKLRQLALALAHREMRLTRDLTPLAGIAEAEAIGGAAVSTFDSGSREDLGDRRALDLEASRQRQLAFASAIGGDDFGGNLAVAVRERLPLTVGQASTDPALSQVIPDGHGGEASLVGDLLVAHSALIEFDPVVDLGHFDFAGHVYNFSTATGAFLMDGIVTANCAMSYITPEGEMEADADSPPEIDTMDTAGDGGGGGALGLPGDALQAPLSSLEGHDADSFAASLARRAAKVEPAITDIMKGSAEANGAKMVGLKYRLKSEASAARKIFGDAADRGMSVEETAQQVSDMVRYTAEFGEEEYVAGVERMLADLQDRGMTIAKFKNTWLPDAPYAGINVQMVAPSGYRFELQFHTPSSFALKEKINHPLYEEWRLLDPASPRAQELTREMIANTAGVPVPPGVRDMTFDRPTTLAGVPSAQTVEP